MAFFKAGPDLGVGCDPLVSGEGPLAEVEGDALVLECHRSMKDAKIIYTTGTTIATTNNASST